MFPCDYPFSTSKRGVTRRQTLSPLPSNTKTQKVEAKWKRNNPLPLAETIIYKGILSVLVEVEANLTKNFQNEFVYDEAYRNLPDAQPVSLTLPLRQEPYINNVMFSFFDGLIPEGWMLNIAERNWKIVSYHYKRNGSLALTNRSSPSHRKISSRPSSANGLQQSRVLTKGCLF